MVLTWFSWPYGGHQVFLSGSFTRWTEHYRMTLAEGSSTAFQSFCNLPPGVYQYRFLVDGIWRYDEQQPCAADDYGTMNNVIFVAEPGISPLHNGPYISGVISASNGIPLYIAPLSSTMPPEPMAQLSDADVEVSRRWVSRLLSNQTVYDILPMSSKVSIVDVQLPVKQAFHIMYEEGLVVVPIWDDRRGCVTGMLTASDFIFILRELQGNVSMLTNEELEMHSVSAWKEGKLQIYRNSNCSLGLHRRPLIHASDRECLEDVALKILQNEISMVPIFKSSLQDGSCMPILNLACLSGILKCICRNFRESTGSVPLLQQPICRIPMGTWLPEFSRGSARHLAILRSNAPLRSALDGLLEARISSIPIVDGNGSLIDVYSRSDIIALAKGDMYGRIQLDEMNMEQALDLVYQANPSNIGRRRCPTCLRSSSFQEIIEQLSDPVVRRLVVVDARSRRVEGIISLRDVLTFLLC